MHPLDLSIFIFYLLGMLGVGVFFMRRNRSTDDYFVGGRKMSSMHIGLSVVATDVGGGFSIGLGGLGFVMGLSGSWLLFTGLIGAWMAGIFLIPRVFRIGRAKGFLTFPQLLSYFFNPKAAIMSTADSCLMASSGNILTDVLGKHRGKNSLKYSQLLTLVIGILALILALKMGNMLELMLLSYAFMVSGLIVPVLAGPFTRKPNFLGAILAMLGGGLTTSILVVIKQPLPLDLDANIFGIAVSLLFYVAAIFIRDYSNAKH